jgi:hypothetical protein
VLVPVMLYSSHVQQPMRATAIMDSRQHTHQAAPLGHEQGRAHSLHPEGRCSVDRSGPMLMAENHSTWSHDAGG